MDFLGIDILHTIVDQPKMRHAACRGEHKLYDDAHRNPAAQEQAERLCSTCVHQPECSKWVATLSQAERLALGTVGGVTYKLAPGQREVTLPTTQPQRSGPRADSGLCEPRSRVSTSGADRQHRRAQSAAQTASRRAHREPLEAAG